MRLVKVAGQGRDGPCQEIRYYSWTVKEETAETADTERTDSREAKVLEGSTRQHIVLVPYVYQG